MTDEYSVEDMLDQTQLTFVDITPLKNPNAQKSKQAQIPTGIRVILDNGKQEKTLSGTQITLGRGKNAQIDLDLNPYEGKKQGVSRSHALINIKKSGVFIKDLNSTNKTFINGQQLYPMRQYAIQDGEQITLGNLVIKVQFIFS